MKKFLLLFTVIFSSLFFTLNVSALTDNQQNALNNLLTNYNPNYPYCVYQYKTNVQLLHCFSVIPSIGTCTSYQCFVNDYGSSYYFIHSNSSPEIIQNSSTYIRDIDEYSNFANIDDSHFTYISIGTPTLYTITFNPPRNSTIVVKNSNNEEIQATSQYTYELEAGTYTYSVTNNLYNNLNNVSFIVSQDETINITMNERLNSQPIRSIYSQYYNYLSELVKDIFGLENPLFLYIVAFIIGFSLITLIRRLIGGR